MAGIPANARKSGTAGVKARPADEKLLQRMAALVSAHPDMDVGEALEAVGVDAVADQRRLRKQFEARRDELVGVIETRRSAAQGKESTRTAALQVAKEERVSLPLQAETARRRPPEPSPREPAPAAAPVGAPAAIPGCAGPAVDAGALAQPLAPFVKAGFDAFATTVRLQAVLFDAWLQVPGVKLAFAQQASAYNAMLGMVARNLPKAR